MNIRFHYFILLAGLLQCHPVASAGLGVQGPLSGYYFDPATGGVYPISGLPGGATLGQELSLNFQFVSIAPDGHTALAVANGVLLLVGNIAEPANAVPLTAWSDPVDRIAWASDASGAVIYSSASNILRTVTGLPGSPIINSQIRLGAVRGAVSNLRLSRAPWNIAVNLTRVEYLSRRGPRGAGQREAKVPIKSLYLLSTSNSPIEVRGIDTPGPMDFSTDAASLYVVDQSKNRVLTVDVATAASTQALPLALAEPGTAGVVDLSVSLDGRYLYTAQASVPNVCGFEIASGKSIFCAAPDIAPDTLRQLGPSLFLLNTPADRSTPLWLLNAGQGSVYFVPRGGPNRG
jgi:hypothetical protein